jgi:hypothetical protein
VYWYYRACRAAVAGAGGHLSGPFLGLDTSRQAAAIRSLLVLPDTIGLPDPQATVPAMAELSERHPQLNLLNLEAAAAAIVLDATVLLSVRRAGAFFRRSSTPRTSAGAPSPSPERPGVGSDRTDHTSSPVR